MPCAVANQVPKISDQVFEPLRSRVSSKNGASSIWGGVRGVGIVLLTDSQSKARGIDVGNIIKRRSATHANALFPCSSRVYLPLTLPHLSPDPVQGCSVLSEQRRSSAMRCPNLAFSPRPPYVLVGNELQRRIFKIKKFGSYSFYDVVFWCTFTVYNVSG